MDLVLDSPKIINFKIKEFRFRRIFLKLQLVERSDSWEIFLSLKRGYKRNLMDLVLDSPKIINFKIKKFRFRRIIPFNS